MTFKWNQAMQIKVSIVEDSRGTRESLAELLGRVPGLRCVGAHANGEEPCGTSRARSRTWC